MKKLTKVFIGYDGVESTAWHTVAHSIMEKSKTPLALIPINIKNLKTIHNRELDSKQSNEFSFTRFLVPYLCDYEGMAIFMDSDMLLRVDINEVFDEINNEKDKAVYVVKHSYEPRDDVKYLGTVQYAYPRKNWSSFVVWNCAHPKNKKLTRDYVNTASGLELHRFTWLDDNEIGELGVTWNWLVGEYTSPPDDVKNVHWTIGGPYFKEYKDADFSQEWFETNERMNFCKQRE
jgi:lipopolysaccharide biosynthesis glycosyltransferase